MNSQKQNLLSKFLEGKLVLRGIYLVGSPKTVFSACTATSTSLAPTFIPINVGPRFCVERIQPERRKHCNFLKQYEISVYFE